MRIGEFSRMTHEYGPSLSVVKPRNNDPGSIVPPELLDPSLRLSEEQRRELAEDIQDLFAVYRGEREFWT